jgi:hypothetical protein
MLLTWRLQNNGELIRLADSEDQAGAVSEISLVRVDADPSGNHRVVTAVRGGDGTLLLISWSIAPDGSSIRRLSFGHGQAVAAFEGNKAETATMLPTAGTRRRRSAVRG